VQRFAFAFTGADDQVSTWPLTKTVLRVAGLVTRIETFSGGILLTASSRSSRALWSAVTATDLPIRACGFVIGLSASEITAHAPFCTTA